MTDMSPVNCFLIFLTISSLLENRYYIHPSSGIHIFFAIKLKYTTNLIKSFMDIELKSFKIRMSIEHV